MGMLRLLLALSVVVHHMPSHSFSLLNAAVAVIIFFMISGFYMTLIINERYSNLNSWQIKFYFSRAARIFPAYWIVLAAGIFFYAFKHESTVFNANLGLGFFEQLILISSNFVLFGLDLFSTLLNSVGSGSKNVFSDFALKIFGPEFFSDNFIVIGQAWSLGSELLFYSLAPFLVTRKRRVIAFLLASIVLRALTMVFSDSFPPSIWGYRFFPTTLSFFCLGSLGYFLYKYVEDKIWAKKFGICVWLSMLIWFVLLPRNGGAFYPSENYDSIGHWVFYMLAAVCIPFLFLASKNFRYDRALGELSYPIYLSHGFLIGVLFNVSFLKPGVLSAELIVIGACIAVSTFLLVVVDRPMDRLRHRMDGVKAEVLMQKVKIPILLGLVAILFLAIGVQFLSVSSTPPHLVQVVGNYNIVNFKDTFYAVPQGLVIDWDKDQVEKMPGVSVNVNQAQLIDSIRTKLDASDNVPHLVKVQGHFNIVKFHNHFYVIPQGIAVDLEKDKVENIKEITVFETLEQAVAKTNPTEVIDDSRPRLLQTLGKYNIVAYHHQFYGILQGIPVDLEVTNVEKMNGVYIGKTLDDVIAQIKKEGATNPSATE